jgi:hypothetical protein
VSETRTSLLLGGLFIVGCLVLAHFTAHHARWLREDRTPACERPGCKCRVCECEHCRCGRSVK